MGKFEDKVKELEKTEPYYFNEENFSRKNSALDFFYYYYNFIIKYTNSDEKKVIEDGKTLVNKDSEKYGIFETSIGPKCIVPKPNNVGDDLKSIELLTKFAYYISHNKTLKYDISSDVIPAFNQYHFLYENDRDLLDIYMLYKKNIAIKVAHTKDINNKEENLKKIYSYLVLEKRKKDYDIRYLNYINCNYKNVPKTLRYNDYSI